MTNSTYFTRSGLPGIDLVPFGIHACHFYGDLGQLIAALAPYFAAGLHGKERCLWITAPPLSVSEAVRALRAAGGGVDDAIQAGALRIVDFGRWAAGAERPGGADIVSWWLEEEERALEGGYNGLRIAGDMGSATGAWSTSTGCDQAVAARFDGRRIVVLCNYALGQCDDQRISEVMQGHHCAFERPGDDWQVVPVPEVLSVSRQVASPRGRVP